MYVFIWVVTALFAVGAVANLIRSAHNVEDNGVLIQAAVGFCFAAWGIVLIVLNW